MIEAKARATMVLLSMGRMMRKRQMRVMILGRIWRLLWEQYPTKMKIYELWICS
jgi:hypothetical protein